MSKFWTAMALTFLWLAVAAAAPTPRNAAATQAPVGNVTGNSAAPSNMPAPAPAVDAPAYPTGNFQAFPDFRDEDCYHTPNHDASDLCAQWLAADAARKSASVADRSYYLALIGTVLSFGSVLLVLVALWQGRTTTNLARVSADEARRAADHQEEQVKLAREVSRAELQPYVHATRALVYLSEDEDRLPSALVTFENSGRTPAVAAEFYAYIDAGDWAAVNNYQPVPRTVSTNVGVIPPDQRRDRQVRLSLESISEAWQKWSVLEADEPGGHFVLRGFIRYYDTFGARYVTEFCYTAAELDNDGETKLTPVHIVGPTYQRVDEQDQPIDPPVEPNATG